MTYPEAIEYLYGLRWFGAKFGLENTLKLCALAGNPQQRLRFIHVAGTNGKGSTCAMLESIYRHAGLKTGLYSSPHLVEFGERIQISRQLIPQADIVRLVARLKDLIGQLPQEEHPTFFEVVTVMAMIFFAEQEVDLVVWETGLGGRLDATNVVTPLASVITNIHYDHQKWLGSSLASIATEKSGIIKPGVRSFTAASEREALEVIRRIAAQQNSSLTEVGESDTLREPLASLRLPLLGQHQKLNAALALAVVQGLQPVLPVSPEAIRSGLYRLDWPGRLQLVSYADGRQILIDGAHNIAGAQTLAQAIRDYFPQTTPTLVLGILQDKDWREMCQLLAPLAARIIAVPVHSDRTAAPHELQEVCHAANPAAEVQEFDSLADALPQTSNDPFVVIAGSLYLVGEAVELLQVQKPRTAQERALNEWGNVAHGVIPPVQKP